jgi:hypothetical protein
MRAALRTFRCQLDDHLTADHGAQFERPCLADQ